MPAGRNKITIVGAGNVGASCAAWCAERGLGDLVLVDIPAAEGMTRGKALDLQQAASVAGSSARFTGTSGYDETADSDVCVVTAGIPRKPGMSREELVAVNQEIVKTVVKKLVAHSPETILIIVTNPLDTMTYAAYQASRLPKTRVMGQAGVLDSARMRTFLAQELGVDVSGVHASVLGGHGDEMVPLARFSTVAGVPVTELIPSDRLNVILERTRKGGGEIVSLLGTSAWYAPGAAAGSMVEAVLKDTKAVVPCSAYLEGEYGLSGMCFGVPCKLGRGGIEQVLEFPLNEEEMAMLRKSAELVFDTMKALK
jgi:malate dehydrogenase